MYEEDDPTKSAGFGKTQSDIKGVVNDPRGKSKSQRIPGDDDFDAFGAGGDDDGSGSFGKD
jgi:hypothetical protein